MSGKKNRSEKNWEKMASGVLSCLFATQMGCRGDEETVLIRIGLVLMQPDWGSGEATLQSSNAGHTGISAHH